MNLDYIKRRSLDACMAAVAVTAGAIVVYAGDWLLGVNLEVYYGYSTYSVAWVLAVFFVPFVAGIVVSMIYGLGGKILAHFSPLIVRAYNYYDLHGVPLEAGSLLPLGYWIFMVILCVEFATIGGVIGEVLVKRTYGRTDRKNLHKLHRKYKKPESASSAQSEGTKGTE